MKVFLIAFTLIFLGCALVDQNVKSRQNETIIRNQLSSKSPQLKACSSSSANKGEVELNIRVGTNKQIVHFSVNTPNQSKALTDCLFKTLDLMYFKDIQTQNVITLNYLLILK